MGRIPCQGDQAIGLGTNMPWASRPVSQPSVPNLGSPWDCGQSLPEGGSQSLRYDMEFVEKFQAVGSGSDIFVFVAPRHYEHE